MVKGFVSSVLALSCFIGLTGVAAADKCKDVDIEVHNEFDDDGVPLQIKIVDMDYWDDSEGKWREEMTSNRIVNPGGRTTYEKNLSFVGGESGVVIRIHFKYLTTNNGWSETLTAESDEFTCNDHDDVDVWVL